jgi:CBS domain-containing protein
MPQCLIVILHKTDKLAELLDTWQAIGVPGVTMFEGVGGFRANQRLKKGGFRSSWGHLFKFDELHSKTLIAVIDGDDLLERAIAEAERLVGDFDDPNTGLLFTLQVNKVIGLLNLAELKTAAPPPRPVSVEIEGKRPGDMPVSALRDTLTWPPIIVQAKQSLLETVEVVVARPNDVDVACVVNQQQRLVGLLPLQNLVDDLFATLEPAEFLSLSIDKDEVMQYAQQTGVHTAGDAMLPAVWVTDQDKVSVAFTKMHDNKLSGIPIVNDRYEVIGFINLQELLAFYIHSQKPSES